MIRIDNISKRLLKRVSFKKFIHNTQKKSYLYNSEYIYPIHDDVIRRMIEGQGHINKVEEYFENNDISFLEQLSKYNEIVGNGFFNPYKYYQLSEYYVKSSSYNELRIIFTYKKTPSLKKNIIHIGDKGSGKTAMQNCWLNEHNKELETNNIYWVRCDGHKIYQLWLNCHDIIESKNNKYHEDRIISIKEYLDLQFLYVFAKYCMHLKRPFFHQMLSSIKNPSICVNYPVGRHDINSTEKRNLFHCILEIKNTIDREEEERKGIEPGYSYVVDEVMKNSFSTHQREKRRWMAISRRLQKELTENGYFFLKIIDGVDNVHINEKKSIPYYNRMINDCHKFITQRPPINEIRLLSLRERTYIDISRIPITNTAPNPIGLRKIIHEPSCLKEISDKRYSFFVKKNDKENNFAKIFEHVSKSIPFSINEIHHNNARTFLFNKSSLILQVYYRIKQLGGSFTNIDNHVSLLTERNKYLNGRLYLDTFHDFSEMNNELGLCCINIFYFNLDDYPCDSPDKWLGLCKTRIMQLLIMHNSLPEKEIVDFLVTCLGYPNQLIINDIADLRAFGMIDSKLDNDNNIVYIYNKKGLLYLHSSYSIIENIYYFMLDTPLPKKMIDEGFVSSHDNKFNRRTEFPYAALSSTISFLTFILYINKIESKKVRENYKKLTLFKHAIPRKLALPLSERKIYTKFMQSGRFFVDRSDKINQENLAIYLEKFTEQWYSPDPKHPTIIGRSS